MATKKNEVQKILDLAGQFVTKQQGHWMHEDWERFLQTAAKAGAKLDDEGKRNLGNLLEASKFLYHHADMTQDAKPAKPKTRAAAAKPATRKKAPAARRPAKGA